MPQYSCNLCGKSFSVRQDIVDRYEKWTPSQCLDCRNGTPNRSANRGSASASPKRTKSRTSSQSLTVAEVLAEFADGPATGVFTDGSSIPNPGPGGWGAVYVVDGDVIDQAYGHDPATTNNRMELVALIEGVRLVPKGNAVTIYSDSNLCVQTVNTWAAGWERNGWKRKSGPIKNLDLVQELYRLAKARPEITFTWIRAHDGSLWNEYADALSTAWNRSDL